METVLINVGQLRRRDDARPLNRAKVDALAASMREFGVMHPLRVRGIRIFAGGQEADGFEVITGAHRLEASRGAAISDLPCVIVTDDDLQAELAMIDENLCRAELGPAETASNVSRRKELYEILHPETAKGSPGVSRQIGDTRERAQTDRFTTDTAERTGRSERAIQRDAERGKRIGGDLKRVAGTSLDKGVELDALARLPADTRSDLVSRAESGERVSARKVVDIPEQEDREQIEAKMKRKLMGAWNDCSPTVQQWFVDNVQVGLIMDERFGE